MIPIKIITKEEAEKNGWSRGMKARSHGGIALSAYGNADGVIEVKRHHEDGREEVLFKKNHKK